MKRFNIAVFHQIAPIAQERLSLLGIIHIPEIIEEFCAQPEECEPPVRECYKSRRKLICVNKFTGKSCRYDDRDRMCRFEYRLERIDCPQAALRCDRNCDPSDPICIPCDLEEIARNCVTQCFPSGNGGTICTTSCTGANGAEA